MGFVTDVFSKRLKDLREEAGMTQTELANELNVSRGAISYYEKGERTPDIEFLDSVALFFNLPTDYLLGITGNAKTEYKNMYNFYGLTDDACEVLDGRDELYHNLGHIISHIITDESFYGIKRLIKNIVKNPDSFDLVEYNYISYVLTQHLKILIIDAVYDELHNQYAETEEDREALSKRLHELCNTEHSLSEYELQEERLSKKYDTKASGNNSKDSVTPYDSANLKDIFFHIDDNDSPL